MNKKKKQKKKKKRKKKKRKRKGETQVTKSSVDAQNSLMRPLMT